MMPVWQEDREPGKPPADVPRYKAQAVRNDGHSGELVVWTDGVWVVWDLCQQDPIARGQAKNLDAAQLIARLVWELSA